jgi:tetratricopeptide (TPR) repeat protein
LTASQHLEELDDLTRLGVDVAVVCSPRGEAPRQTPAERLAEAEKELKANPGDANAQYRRGLAYYRAGAYEQALADFSQLVPRFPTWAEGYQYRAQFHAALGHAAEARADVEQYRKLGTDPHKKLALGVIVDAWLGQDGAGVERLEAALLQHPHDPDLLYEAGWTCTLVSQIVQQRQARQSLGWALAAVLPSSGQPWSLPALAAYRQERDRSASERSQHDRARALTLLSRAVEEGYSNFGHLAADPDLASLHDEPAFAALLRHRQLDLRYAVVLHGSPAHELAHCQGLDLARHLARCQELASQGYRPVALSVAPSREADSKGEVLVGTSPPPHRQNVCVGGQGSDGGAISPVPQGQSAGRACLQQTVQS